jgi:hypothetical protein
MHPLRAAEVSLTRRTSRLAANDYLAAVSQRMKAVNPAFSGRVSAERGAELAAPPDSLDCPSPP